MKWALPAFALSLIVFLLLFTVIDRRGAPTPNPSTSGYGTDADGSRLGALPAHEIPGPAGDGVSSAATAERAVVPPPALAAELTLSATERTALEARLEREVIDRARSLWGPRQHFSRAAPRARVTLDEIVRIEVPDPYAGEAMAAFLLRGDPRKWGDAHATLPARTLLLLRMESVDEPLQVLVTGSASADGTAGSSGAPMWVPAENLLSAHRSGVPRIAALPVAPDRTVRRRATGSAFEEPVVERFTKPLEERREELDQRALFSRVFPAPGSFTLSRRDADAIAHAGADGEWVLSVTGPEAEETLVVPVRRSLLADRIEVFHRGAWVDAHDWARRIEVRYVLEIDEDPVDDAPVNHGLWVPRWQLEGETTNG